MKLRKAYQTLENRNNPDKIEEQGPFLCSHKNAWLGKGYYFWDSFIENAHWWGQKGARYKNGYVICESTFELDEDNLKEAQDALLGGEIANWYIRKITASDIQLNSQINQTV